MSFLQNENILKTVHNLGYYIPQKQPKTPKSHSSKSKPKRRSGSAKIMASSDEEAGPSSTAKPVGRPRRKGPTTSTSSAKKPKKISAAFSVRDRVLYAVLSAAEEIVSYDCATIVKIVIDENGSLYSIKLDKDDETIENVSEDLLFNSVEM